MKNKKTLLLQPPLLLLLSLPAGSGASLSFLTYARKGEIQHFFFEGASPSSHAGSNTAAYMCSVPPAYRKNSVKYVCCWCIIESGQKKKRWRKTAVHEEKEKRGFQEREWDEGTLQRASSLYNHVAQSYVLAWKYYVCVCVVIKSNVLSSVNSLFTVNCLLSQLRSLSRSKIEGERERKRGRKRERGVVM